MELDLRSQRDTLPPGLRGPATVLGEKTLWALQTYVEIYQIKLEDISSIWLDLHVGSISAVCKLAEDIAKAFDADVHFKFNGRPIVVYPSAARAAQRQFYDSTQQE